MMVAYSRNYQDFAPVIGLGMAAVSKLLTSTPNASLTYLNSQLATLSEVSARITIEGWASTYYAEAYCSWDGETWYLKGSGTITVQPEASSGLLDLNYTIYQSGNLHTKVDIYDSQGGTKLAEFEKK